MVKNKILKRIVAGLSCIALSTTMLTSLPAFADDYVDEYQYYSTLDPNGEEYQEWKSNLASSAVSVPQNRCCSPRKIRKTQKCGITRN